MSRPPRIGDMLVAAGKITEDQLQKAVKAQKGSGKRLGELLVERGEVSEIELVQILSNQLSVAWVSLDQVDFSDDILDLIPGELARQYTLIPVHFRVGNKKEQILYVAMDDPTNIDAMEKVSQFTGTHVRPMIAPPSEIRRAIEMYYSQERKRNSFPF